MTPVHIAKVEKSKLNILNVKRFTDLTTIQFTNYITAIEVLTGIVAPAKESIDL